MTTPPTTYEIHGRSVAGESASIDAGNQTIPIDARWAPAEPSGLPGPAELLASALAACMLKNLERSSSLMPFRFESAEVNVHSRRQDAPPQFVEFEYEVRLVTDEEERRIELLHRNLNHYGTVYNTLAAVANVHGTIVVVKPSSES